MSTEPETKPFKKVVRLGRADLGDLRADVFCKIEFKERGELGELSISGVEGPRPSGNAAGSCGQIDMHMDEQYLVGMQWAPGWDLDTGRRFVKVWRDWHLNHMRAFCEHQRALGWRDKAGQNVELYYFSLTAEVSAKRRAAEDRAKAAIVKGETFTPTPEETRLAGLPYEVKLPVEQALNNARLSEFYQPGGIGGRKGETKALGWLTPEEHHDGLLSRPCPTCGYKYGSAWRKEPVPRDVLQFLQELPDADKQPAWV